MSGSLSPEATARTSELGATVKFNVGGRIFEVLKDPTLSLFPGSLLNTLADQRQNDEPIFVEANSDLFPYILDYHRYRKIAIPYTVSKDAVLREAAVMGLDVKPDDIQREGIPWYDVVEGVVDVEEELLAKHAANRRAFLCSTAAVVSWRQMKAATPMVKTMWIEWSQVTEAVIAETRAPSSVDFPCTLDFGGSGIQVDTPSYQNCRLHIKCEMFK